MFFPIRFSKQGQIRIRINSNRNCNSDFISGRTNHFDLLYSYISPYVADVVGKKLKEVLQTQVHLIRSIEEIIKRIIIGRLVRFGRLSLSVGNWTWNNITHPCSTSYFTQLSCSFISFLSFFLISFLWGYFWPRKIQLGPIVSLNSRIRSLYFIVKRMNEKFLMKYFFPG